MEFTDLLSELTRPTTATHIVLISFGAFVGFLALAITFDSLKSTSVGASFTILALGSVVVMIITTIYSASETVKYDYELSRDKNYIYIDSHNNNLKSAKLKIIGEEKNTIYVLYEDKTYKIPVMIDKR